MIGIIDYGINNLGSVKNAVDELNVDYEVLVKPCDFSFYDLLILPGVGSFDSGIKALKSSGLYEALSELGSSNKKILGICLGMQLLCSESEEGVEKGLNLIPAKVKHLSTFGCRAKVPHVGFNNICSAEDPRFLRTMINQDYYFVHSYSVETNSKNMRLAFTDYEGTKLVGAYRYGNIMGTQFHPEKSGVKGLEIIKRAYLC